MVNITQNTATDGNIFRCPPYEEVISVPLISYSIPTGSTSVSTVIIATTKKTTIPTGCHAKLSQHTTIRLL